ncbi:MAG: hypothetical protein ABI945_07760, partial [Nitrospirales bacterium]
NHHAVECWHESPTFNRTIIWSPSTKIEMSSADGWHADRIWELKELVAKLHNSAPFKGDALCHLHYCITQSWKKNKSSELMTATAANFVPMSLVIRMESYGFWSTNLAEHQAPLRSEANGNAFLSQNCQASSYAMANGILMRRTGSHAHSNALIL